jgi:2-methylisocitrate lyase-like PEP mutase family enzyme
MNNCEKFCDLHNRIKPLVIANAWNAKSAQIIEKNGLCVTATECGIKRISMAGFLYRATYN